jgi:hypothetical protein
LIEGKCTQEGTQQYKEYGVKQGFPAKNFRRTFPLPSLQAPSTDFVTAFDLSTVGYGTYQGLPDD